MLSCFLYTSAASEMRKPGSFTYLLALVACLLPEVWSLRQNQTWPRRTYPGQLEYPHTPCLNYFGKLLDGDLILPYNDTYLNESLTHNRRIWKLPGFIVKAKTVQDVQKSILFARRHNLHLTVWSSGHDYIGRSTHDGSLNLNLENLNSIKVKLDSSRNRAGEVTIQTGATWQEVYDEIDKVQGPDETGQKKIGRVIVGATGQTVAIGGFTQGGGHSPIARKLGLAVDNLLEATIVTPDARVHIVNKTTTVTRSLNGSVTVSDDTSLFWGIRGGGGGTWGVITDFTFKIHFAPERFRRVLMMIPTLDKSGKPINKDVIDFALQQINKLSPDWGGYYVPSLGLALGGQYHGLQLIYLNHYGSNSSSSNQEIEALLQNPKWTEKVTSYHPTFLLYEDTIPEIPHDNSYVFNTFVQRSSLEDATKRAEFVNLMSDIQQANMFCYATLIGGNMANVSKDSTPIHPGFRSGIFSMTCGADWEVEYDNATIEKVLSFAPKLYKFGWGTYFSKPAEDMPDWKLRFWGSHETYNRLLSIKKKYDPSNYLWCHNCVGSDLGPDYGSSDLEGIPGQTVRTYYEPSGV